MASKKPSDSDSEETLSNPTKEQFLKGIEESRLAQGASVEYFHFNKSRCRVISENDKIQDGTRGVLYWMIRDCRVQDNWAMLFAQRLALKEQLPLFVAFTLFEAHCLRPTRRHQQFLIDGLKHVEKECKLLNIPFYLLNNSIEELTKMIKKHQLGAVVCDFHPLKKPREWIKNLVDALPETIPVVQVDAHNIVPAWQMSHKVEYRVDIMHTKIQKKLPEYLTGFPVVAKHPHSGKLDITICPFKKALSSMKTLWDVEPVKGLKAGPQAGLEQLHSFIVNRLRYYGISSDDVSKNHTSDLSFWMNFGHIAPQRVVLEVKSIESVYRQQAEMYLKEVLVHRELAENYCFYNENYDNLKGAWGWAQKTLNDHRLDKRYYIYTKEKLAIAKTHDDCWNAAQIQMLKEGKMHGTMRMYWAKKVLEWTKSPEEAIEIAQWLNDTFALDGNDPNSYVGVMRSICGVHDHGWTEREIFGKILYMVDEGLMKKFDMNAYCARYGISFKASSKKGVTKPQIKRKAS